MSGGNNSFVHLHVHSEFSLLDGLSRIDHLALRAKELNMPALALTDHGTMYGTIQFYRACQKQEIKPIIGVESYVAARGLRDKQADKDRERYHLLLLAQNRTGYLNLLNIVSTAQLEGFYYRPRTDHDFLQQHSQGLIATTGCLAGEIPRAIHRGDVKKADSLLSWYVDVFGRDRFFVELQDHSIPELVKVNRTLMDLAGRYNLRYLATNDVHYTTAAEASPHDVLLCIQTNKLISSNDRMRMSDQGYYLKSYQEMEKLFGHIEGALENTLLVAEMCDVDPEPPGYHLPKFDVPEGYTTESYLRFLCEAGLIRRYGEYESKNNEELRARLDYELEIIIGMGFAAYFLIVWDLCEFARREDIWWNVRGSGAGSVVAFTLGITGIDPIENGLIFERFLNPDRVSMPDIDLDYPDNRRHEMIEYTIQKYGSEKVAQIITFGTMGARAAIRDVGRAMAVPLSDVDDLAKTIPAIPGKPVKISEALNSDHEFFSADLLRKYKENEDVKSLVDTAINLEGVARHASTHAAGVIISDKPLIEYTPLHRPTSGSGSNGDGIGVVTQWPMEILDSIGLLKVDFLGLSTLTVLRRAAELIEDRCGISYTMENIPYKVEHIGPDPEKKPEALFEMLGLGQVAGVFQVEGAGMRRLMLRMKPKQFNHIVAAISLFRPGPMDNISEYVGRMHGKKKVVYHHADLEPILNETYGIVVYQEQIIRIAADFAGYTPGEADMLRKAVAKKKKKLMDKHQTQFVNGAMAKGYSQDICEAIWGDIVFFARYGFNKAHAADYAVITCQTAFLKAHYPVEYMTALMSVERNNTEKVANYLAEARRLDIEVAPPTINKAWLDFAIEGDSKKPIIRYGLGAIKNAGVGPIEFILEDRSENGSFLSLADFSERVDLRRVGKRALESMIKVGVFDEWGTRPQILESLDRLIGHSGSTHDAAAAGQMTLFGGSSGSDIDINFELLKPAENLKSIDRREILNWEKELIGVYISEHPLNPYLNLASELSTTPSMELDINMNGRSVALLGLITYLRTHITKKGAAMAFGNLEDLHGTVELIFFPQSWAKFRDDVEIDQVYLIRGKVRIEDDERSKVVVNSIESSLSLSQPSKQEKPMVIVENDVPDTVSLKTDAAEDFGSSPELPPLFNGQEAGVEHAQLPEQPLPEQPLPELNVTFFPDSSELIETAVDRPIDETVTVDKIVTVDKMVETTVPVQIEANGPKRMVVVDIEPVKDWREACRLLVKMANDYRGRDSLRIRLTGYNIAMDFPNQNTLYCPNLVDEMRKLPAVNSVLVQR